MQPNDPSDQATPGTLLSLRDVIEDPVVAGVLEGLIAEVARLGGENRRLAAQLKHESAVLEEHRMDTEDNFSAVEHALDRFVSRGHRPGRGM